mmetsp:Transcript_115374/g.230029  ORF Transcript_115374/g.230029 Transcript_115374/m.230029 type:complete len:468 (-) Transcript_115374:298-1701(-)
MPCLKEASRFSWRDEKVSDWTVTLGPHCFRLHRWQLLRFSGFFEGQFNAGFEATQTDLTHMLPEIVWPAFETCLDYIYEEIAQSDIEASSPKVLLSLLKIADCLEIRGLLAILGSAIDNVIKTMPVSLLSSVDGLVEADGDRVHAVIQRASTQICREFHEIVNDCERFDSLLQLPAIVIKSVLAADDLVAESEDVVLFFLRRYTSDLDFKSAASLWRLLRVPFLSRKGVLELDSLKLNATFNLPLLQGLLLKLAWESQDGAAKDRLLREDPSLQSWCVPRKVLHTMVETTKNEGGQGRMALVGERPLLGDWLNGNDRSFEFQVAGELHSLCVGVCFDDVRTRSECTLWKEIDFIAINLWSQVKTRTGSRSLAEFMPDATKGFNLAGRPNLEVGDIVRATLTSQRTLMIAVNGVPTVFAPLDLAPCYCQVCNRGLSTAKCLRFGTDASQCGAYPMIGLPHSSLVQMMP